MPTLLSIPKPGPRELLPALARRPLGVPSSTQTAVTPKPFGAPPPGPVIRAVLWLRRALLRLADSVVPANVALFERSFGVAQTALIGAAARHGFADQLQGGPLTAAELAATAKLHAESVHRMLRGLVHLGVFTLRPDGKFANNRLSRALAGGTLHRTREWAQYVSSQSNLLPWIELERALVDGKNNFERTFGMSVWDWFERHPDEQEMFAQSMMGLTSAHAPVLASLYPFVEVKSVCDVGGGRGTLLSEILVRHPHLHGVLCDAPGVLESARVLLGQRGLEDRVALSPGNFFESVRGGAELYTLKNILHDWDDEACKKILRNVRRATEPGQRVLLVESLQERNDWKSLAAMADLQMMLVRSNGRERSAAELQQLLRDSGFSPGRVFRHPIICAVEGRAG